MKWQERLRRLIIVAALTITLLIGVVQFALTFTEVGITSEIGMEGLLLSDYDLSVIPPSVAEDATKLAVELYGDSQEKCNNFINQILSIYKEAENKDIIVIFNSGGWGWNPVERSPGWLSIFSGIETKLAISGYSPLLLNHQRTAESIGSRFDEIVQMITHYPSKANDLASRVEFLTGHFPDLSVVLAGESNGTVICDRAMSILSDNPHVYSIQTGPPFWYQNVMSNRTLLLTNNGTVPDAFSQGDIITMLRANLKAWLGMSKTEDNSGTILHYVRAPGHDYQWYYPKIYSQITEFLDKSFGPKWR